MALTASLSAVDWAWESYPAYQDFVFLPVLIALLPIFRFFLDRFVFELILKPFAKMLKLSALDCVEKFYLCMLLMMNRGSKAQDIFGKVLEIRFGLTRKLSLNLKLLTYFGVSMSHHVATALLILLSYIFRFARVGSVVLAIHDASDVFLEIGKMSKYCGYENLAAFSFLLFVASWIILRLIFYPFWILRSTSYEVLLTLDKEKHKFDGPLYYYIFNTLLFSLLVLHIYWWVLIYRMLLRQIQLRGYISDDVRSDSEGEDEHED
ncbi:hypothetical protein HPP92_019152 [Vanilla planifolia]|uniref:TLC domain-containing protein n=1 Tax=Vanilla planifolia TaxID=51239 RepID=A0A835UMX7_VANPL|nr:hypothetical protein HPP92_019152 [Vanilla planifolia]